MDPKMISHISQISSLCSRSILSRISLYAKAYPFMTTPKKYMSSKKASPIINQETSHSSNQSPPTMATSTDVCSHHPIQLFCKVIIIIILIIIIIIIILIL